MNTQRLFASGRFAKLSRTTRSTLHLYDRIGLLPPLSRGDNHYRYYSTKQLATVNVIRIMQEMGMSLDEIRTVKDQRDPKSIDHLLLQQIQKIDRKIDDWVSARKLLLTLQRSIHSVLDIDETALTVQFLPAEAIILGGLNDYSRGQDEYSALLSFYHAMDEQEPGLNLNYPVWARYSEERIKQRDWHWPDRYYFYNPEGRDKRPAALYAIGYTRGGYGQADDAYGRLLDFIEQIGFEICGDAYEEYPLNEFSVADEDDYLIRVMITVREKRDSAAAAK